MTTKMTRPCAAADRGCTCNGNTRAHNLQAHQRQMTKVAAHSTATCPKCDGPANPALLATWGHCVRCQNATIGR